MASEQQQNGASMPAEQPPVPAQSDSNTSPPSDQQPVPSASAQPSAVTNGGSAAPPSSAPAQASAQAQAPAPAPAPAQAPAQAPASAPEQDATQAQAISRDEVALYDRQIRLWGMQAQEKIRNARILLITLKGLGNEIAKNLVLAGIGSLTISDPQQLTADDLGAQFFINEQDVSEGKTKATAALPRIQALNQRVKVQELQTDPFTATDVSFLRDFTLVIATDLPVVAINQLSAACRLAGKPFYAAGCHGIYGYIFADLIEHQFSITRDAPNVPTTVSKMETPTRRIVDSVISTNNGKRTEIITKCETYQPFILINSAPLPEDIVSKPRALRRVPVILPLLRALWAFEQANNGYPPTLTSSEHLRLFTQGATEKSRELQLPMDHIKAESLRSFLQNVYLELAPVAGVLGAAVAQDVINVLSGREQPIQNLLLFDGDEGTSEILPLHPFVTTQDLNL